MSLAEGNDQEQIELTEADKSFIESNEAFMQLRKECTDSDYLLNKHTVSFRCLTQVLLSSSSLMKNRLFVFPPLENPGIEEAFDYIEQAPSYDNIGIEKYRTLCKDLEIVPLSQIVNALATPNVNLKFYGLTKKQMQALTETLKGNVYVENLNLEENFLTIEMMSMLSSMLQENGALRVLKLRHCQIGESGAEMLNEALASSQFLSELDLSCNALGDGGLRLIMNGLCETPALSKLNLSDNGLTEDCTETLERILLENKTITELDLSWNGFYTGPGNKKLFSGMQKNDQIVALNLAWNGISSKAAIVPVAKYIRHSENLRLLNLSYNRLEGPSLKPARSSITKNHSLLEVQIGNNPYHSNEAKELVNMLITKGKDPLNYLDMENIYLEKDAEPLLSRVKALGKTVIIGGILSNYSIKGPDIKKLLFDRCRFILQKPKKKKAKKDFAHFVLALPDKPIPMQEFETLIKKKKMKKLDKDLLKELTLQFPAKRKRIDCLEMKATYKSYFTDAALPPEKIKKKKKGKGRKRKFKIATPEPEINAQDKQIDTEDRTVDKPSQGQITEGNSEHRVVLFSNEFTKYEPLEEKTTNMNEEIESKSPHLDNEKDEEKELQTIELEAEQARINMPSSFENKAIY